MGADIAYDFHGVPADILGACGAALRQKATEGVRKIGRKSVKTAQD
jgi:hypothetical protein